MKLDIAIVNYNTDFFLLNLLSSIRDVLPVEALSHVWVWDNGSVDASAVVLEAFGKELPALRVHRSPVNIYHGPALDTLMRDHCSGSWVLVLDSDTEVRRDFLPALPPLTSDPPVFVGQIAPTANQFYAYRSTSCSTAPGTWGCRPSGITVRQASTSSVTWPTTRCRTAASAGATTSSTSARAPCGVSTSERRRTMSSSALPSGRAGRGRSLRSARRSRAGCRPSSSASWRSAASPEAAPQRAAPPYPPRRGRASGRRRRSRDPCGRSPAGSRERGR